MLPDVQELIDEVDGLGHIPDSTLESIATAGIIEFLQGTPLNPSLKPRYLIEAADPIQCLKRQDGLGLLVRKLLDLLSAIFNGDFAGTGLQFFDTVELMQADTGVWTLAMTKNYYPGDHYLGLWVRVADLGITANGSDLLQAADGSTLWRMVQREYMGSEVVIDPTITPYTVSGMTVFPTLTDARNSFVNTQKIEVLPQIDGNGGGDLNNEYAMFVRGGVADGIDGMDYLTTQSGFLYTRI